MSKPREDGWLAGAAASTACRFYTLGAGIVVFVSGAFRLSAEARTGGPVDVFLGLSLVVVGVMAFMEARKA